MCWRECRPTSPQRAIVAEIEAEHALVAVNRELIRRMEAKVKAPVDRVWGKSVENGGWIYSNNLDYVSKITIMVTFVIVSEYSGPLPAEGASRKIGPGPLYELTRIHALAAAAGSLRFLDTRE